MHTICIQVFISTLLLLETTRQIESTTDFNQFLKNPFQVPKICNSFLIKNNGREKYDYYIIEL